MDALRAIQANHRSRAYPYLAIWAYTFGCSWLALILYKSYVLTLPALGEPDQQPFFAGPGLEVSLCRYFQNGYIQSLICYESLELGIFLLKSL